jgi:DNA replication and repair protein RecF
MWLKSLQAQNLRSFEKFDLAFSPNINFFIGDNGAGKTSILEAVDVLSRGKSFRANHLKHIANYHDPRLTIYSELQNSTDHTVQLGIQYQNNATEIRINREKVKKWSKLAAILPVIDIHPESYTLITGGPVERRKYLAWGTFHVEPSFLKQWTEYHRALKQRNICLKEHKIQEARYWHPVLIENGELISQQFASYIERLISYINELLSEFELPMTIEFNYCKGFKGPSLAEQLEKELKNQVVPLVTGVGPHRSDILISWNGQNFAKTSSRGQQKVLALVLKLAQARLLSTTLDKPSVYLIDELPAELDQKHCMNALNIIKGLNSQAFITSVSTDRIDKFISSNSKMFHVEQGIVSEMV